MNVENMTLQEILAAITAQPAPRPGVNAFESCGCDECNLADRLAAQRASDPDVTKHFDLARLGRLTDQLSLTTPVLYGKLVPDAIEYIRPVQRKEDIDTFGATKHRPGFHIVMIHPWMLDHLHGQANETLCHELVHCMQAESMGVQEMAEDYDFQMKTRGYFDNPYEVEARHYGDQLATEFSIVVR